ncbi:MAG: thiolase domain-containing protein [Anaerolineaceae bacterium]|jgi:acetyl-CoA C-acetyltransferase
MNTVYITGIGQVAVGEHWEKTLAALSTTAIRAALKDAGSPQPEIVYIGNFLASSLSHQANLGALVCDAAGLNGVEGTTVEAGEASGAAALHMGCLAIGSGLVDCVVVVGVEKMTDMVGTQVEAFAAQSGDYDFETMQGLTPTGMAGLLMQRYLDQTQAPRDAFSVFPITAHRNGVNNPYAMYRKAIDLETYHKAPLVSAPLTLYDVPSYADGAAALVLVSQNLLRDGQKAVIVSASEIATDTLAVHDRSDPLAFEAVHISTANALEKAGLTRDCLDLFECWDTPSIYGMLSLEAGGFAARGQGWQFATPENLALTGRLPVATMGGIKAHGFAPGAAGIYQVLDAVQQLRGEAGQNQIAGAQIVMTQALSAAAASAITHIIRKA